jgi:hypothetical protein
MLSRRVQQKLMQQIRRKFNVSVKYAEIEDGCSAQADTGSFTVEISEQHSAATKGKFLSTLLHEVVHILAWREWDKFAVFHAPKNPEELSISELRTFLQTAWRAERWTELKAREMLHEMYPGEVFWFSYGRLKGRERSKDWFDTVFLADYRKAYRHKLLRRKARTK